MHIPDGFLSGPVNAACAAVAVAGIALALARVRRTLAEHQVPLLGMTAAFVFAAQMLNFPVAGGTSGHVLGAAFATALLGPWGAGLVISLVLIVQCLLFADGGLLALGCNILNLALWPALVGLPIYQFAQRSAALRRIPVLPAMLAVIVSLSLGAGGVVVETVLSGRSELPFGPFALIMLAEGVNAARKKLRFHPVSLLAFGLGIALASGFVAVGAGLPFMTGMWLPTFSLPVMGAVHLGTPVMFDVGVYFAVIGFTLGVLFELEDMD